jgi:hypothetical protein
MRVREEREKERERERPILFLESCIEGIKLNRKTCMSIKLNSCIVEFACSETVNS